VRLKLDENLGQASAQALRAEGHDVATIHEQSLAGIPDSSLIEVFTNEGRCLVTLDVEFGNPILFKPAAYAGIAVLRVPSPITQELLNATVETLADALAGGDIRGKRWIVQPGRIREHQEE
jgi:predicted nuclease of predicted toxin-antitoxin system